MKTPLPRISLPVLRFFRAFTRRLVASNFHAVRLSRDGFPPTQSAQPTIVFLNHAAWWDPLACFFLAEQFFARCDSYAPMDQAQLRRYGILRKIGLFPSQNGSFIGGRALLEIGERVLSRPHAVLWITPESRFVDVRVRPLHFAAGLAHLIRRVRNVRVIPLALEYAYWRERRPELLVRFGDVRHQDELCAASSTHQQLTEVLEQQLAATMDALAHDSVVRDPTRFVSLFSRRNSLIPVYDFGRQIRALWKSNAIRTVDAVGEA
jgi:1-acyl-sn-glycerol-3-phosphate acyltransferase